MAYQKKTAQTLTLYFLIEVVKVYILFCSFVFSKWLDYYFVLICNIDYNLIKILQCEKKTVALRENIPITQEFTDFSFLY